MERKTVSRKEEKYQISNHAKKNFFFIFNKNVKLELGLKLYKHYTAAVAASSHHHVKKMMVESVL